LGAPYCSLFFYQHHNSGQRPFRANKPAGSFPAGFWGDPKTSCNCSEMAAALLEVGEVYVMESLFTHTYIYYIILIYIYIILIYIYIQYIYIYSIYIYIFNIWYTLLCMYVYIYIYIMYSILHLFWGQSYTFHRFEILYHLSRYILICPYGIYWIVPQP
jgi:hypothetical protein